MYLQISSCVYREREDMWVLESKLELYQNRNFENSMYTFVITPLTLSISTSELVFMSTFIGILGNASKTLSSKGIQQSSFFTSHVTPIGIKNCSSDQFKTVSKQKCLHYNLNLYLNLQSYRTNFTITWLKLNTKRSHKRWQVLEKEISAFKTVVILRFGFKSS